MSNLLIELEQAVEFLRKYPKLEGTDDLKSVSKKLSESLGKFLVKAEDMQLEQLPGFSEVSSLIEGDGKKIAKADFMNKFCRTHLRESLKATRADRATKRKFLRLVAKGNKLEELKKQLDPHQRFRDLFDELVRLDSDDLREKLSQLTPSDLTGLCKANGIKALMTATGMVSRRPKSLDQIVSQIEQVKRSQHF